MKLLPLFLLLLSAVFCHAGSWNIVVPVNASPLTRTAAAELKEHLDKALQKKIPIIREGEKRAGRKIYLGDTLLARQLGIDFSRFGKEESLIRRNGSDILLGGGAPRGCLYSVYEFLERFVSVSWLDPYTTVIPRVKSLSLPEKTDLRISPSFANRGIFILNISARGGRFYQQNLRFRSRMRENIFWQEKISAQDKERWGITPIFGRPAPLNTLYYYIREWPQKGMETALSLDKTGKRLRPAGFYGPGHVCFSSPLARRQFAKQLKGYIARDRKENPRNFPAFYNLSINDSDKGFCVCSGCRALKKKYKAHSGAMLEFVNFAAQEAAKVYPDIRIQTSAYLFTEKPPVGIRPRKNVFVRVSPIDTLLGGRMKTMLPLTHPVNREVREMIQKWNRLGKLHVWSYWINFGRYYSNACMINAESIYKDLLFYKKHGAEYIFAECEAPVTTTFHPLRVYLGYQIQRDHTQKFETVLNRFFTNYYGPAAVPMRKLYDYICKRQKEHPDLSVRGVQHLNFADKAFFRQAERLLAEAEKAAGKDKALLQRIALERVPLDCARLTFRDTWPREKNLPERPKVLSRLRKNWPRSILYWNGDTSIGRAAVKNMLKQFAEFEDIKPGARYPLPPQLAKREVFEMTSDRFQILPELVKYNLKLADDKDSCDGKALKLGEHPTLKNIHSKRFECGVRSRFLNKDLLKYRKPVKKDEKYNIYHLGRFTATPQTLLWLHSSWYMQQNLSFLYRQGADNVFDIYVSLKFCGPAYSPGSKKENAIYMDRILLVKAAKK